MIETEGRRSELALRLINQFASHYADMLDVGGWWKGARTISEGALMKEEFRCELAVHLAVAFRRFGVLTHEDFTKIVAELEKVKVKRTGEGGAEVVVRSTEKILDELEKER